MRKTIHKIQKRCLRKLPKNTVIYKNKFTLRRTVSGQRSTTTTDPGVGPEDKEDCNSPASLTAVSLGKMDRANEYVKNCSNSTKQIAVGNSCSEESIAYEKLTMIERELEDMEVTLSVMREKQRGQTLSEGLLNSLLG